MVRIQTAIDREKKKRMDNWKKEHHYDEQKNSGMHMMDFQYRKAKEKIEIEAMKYVFTNLVPRRPPNKMPEKFENFDKKDPLIAKIETKNKMNEYQNKFKSLSASISRDWSLAANNILTNKDKLDNPKRMARAKQNFKKISDDNRPKNLMNDYDNHFHELTTNLVKLYSKPIMDGKEQKIQDLKDKVIVHGRLILKDCKKIIDAYSYVIEVYNILAKKYGILLYSGLRINVQQKELEKLKNNIDKNFKKLNNLPNHIKKQKSNFLTSIKRFFYKN